MSDAALVTIDSLEVGYGPVEAVKGVSLELPHRRLTALVGPSGCGKTTLLRAIAGFEVPRAGEIRLGGDTLAGPGRWVEPERRQIGMVFQEGALFPHLTVAGNVAYGLHRLDRAARTARVGEVLDLVRLSGLAERYPDQLSGGQQRRVALARALAPEPRLVLLDEPFAGLDAGLRDRLRREVRRILEQVGATALLVTHDQSEALSIADRVVVMAAGRVLQTGTPEEIYRRPLGPEVARFLGGGALLACEVVDGESRSALGSVPAPEGTSPGRAFLFVRPEDLTIESGAGDGPGRGRVVERRFFGHDVLDRVRLASGEEVEVRLLASEAASAPAVGAEVTVRLRAVTPMLFPRS